MKKVSISLLIFTLLLASFFILTTGEVDMSSLTDGIFKRLLGHSSHWNPVLDERLPRLLVLLCTGAALAVSGAVMQSLFHNPLASPGILGMTSGGSLFVVLVFITGIQATFPISIPLAAILGSFLTLLFVYSLSKLNGTITTYHLLLSGIALSTVFISLQSAILYCYRDHWSLLQVITEWQAGSTFNRNWQHVNMQLPVTIVGLSGPIFYRKELNILALGEEEALNLGVEAEQVRWRLFLCVALLTGGALAGMGSVTFFGLILPHLLRTLFGCDHRIIIPLCILLGSSLLCCLDLILRSTEIYSLTIGNISAIIGGLFFFVLLVQSHTRRQYA